MNTSFYVNMKSIFFDLSKLKNGKQLVKRK